jgi:fluoride exporter
MTMTAFTLTNFVAIGVGAALGAWSRWGLSIWLNSGPDRFPVGTFVANLGGSYLIGLAVAWSLLHPGWPAPLRLMLVTGLLGALTTFSTFSAEAVTFFHEGRWSLGFIYAGSSLIGCLLMTALGWWSLTAFRT